MQRGRKSQRDTLIEAQRSNNLMADLAGKPRMDYSFHGEPLIREPVKRAPRKPTNEPTEHQLQAAVIKWWSFACTRYCIHEYLLFAIPNGGARDAITGARLKAEGVRKGVLDLMLAVPRDQFHGMFIEMKRLSGRLSVEQTEMIVALSAQGYYCVTCYDTEDAIAMIKSYLV